MIIKECNKKDIERIVSIHLAAFNGFFLSSLGASFLRTYYKSYFYCPGAILLSAIEDNQIIGFAAAATKSRGFNKRLILNSLSAYMWQVIQLLFTNPKAILHLVKNMSKSSPHDNDRGEYGELYSIAVAPNQQGKGVGRDLLKQVEKRARQEGSVQFSLTTDYYNNEKTIGFYNSMGYEVYYDFVAYPDRRMFRLIKHL